MWLFESHSSYLEVLVHFPLPFLAFYVYHCTKSLDNVNFTCLNVRGGKKRIQNIECFKSHYFLIKS